MRIDWLEDILLVADTGSFSAAAERRGLTKSAFSRRLRHIESQIGAELFDRTSKPATINPQILSHRDGIVRALAVLNEVVHDLQHTETPASEVVRIGTTPSLSLTWVPELAARAHSVAPQVSTRIFARGRDDVIAMLLSRSVDLLVVPRLKGWSDALATDIVDVYDLGTERLIPYGHPGLVKMFSLNNTARLPVILYPPDTFFSAFLEHNVLPAARKIKPLNLVAETGSTIGLMGYVAEGLGFGWLPESLAGWCVKPDTLLDVSKWLPTDTMSVSVVRLKNLNHPTRDKIWAASTVLTGSES